MILVSARCTIHPDHYDSFADQVEQIIPLVRAEPGCIRYELHADVYEQGLFIFSEEWESRKHLDDHLTSAHMQEHVARTADWKTSPVEVTVYDVSHTQKMTL